MKLYIVYFILVARKSANRKNEKKKPEKLKLLWDIACSGRVQKTSFIVSMEKGI